uniref:Tetraspanin n=2 Tax=Aplanochytrium stocchinoi TaxID=215587 RepID=A0A6S8F9F1_9STRA|mmetsp:Transcript_13338/g.17288  ORF Transcript_13338/g.17288 Transcript_13338/m.17288 type:complete len:414 (+) Transcript_13338:229-1470(+)|eukprot:CAMPEP_0204863174 /NCGR_PEP_ID=MMETSP1348-20121228/3108_1 /ASSEMBLY_ACC=CAM_ASM_000700 /TAXON_ID=215587 /ORGANISM="Aplanochytrium stocchinoi, Strain GSBS06" /LENGTH=413 /DNA_ID=CAMNT_0052013415 /DNA_START=138 /DNA_END=1379 /DNA_ORIENTATION=-
MARVSGNFFFLLNALVGVSGAVILGGLVGNVFTYKDLLTGSLFTYVLPVIIVAAVIIVTSLTAYCAHDRHKKKLLIATLFLHLVFFLIFIGLGFIALIIADVGSLASMYAGAGPYFTELKVEFVQTVFNDCCVASGFGGVLIPQCDDIPNATVLDFCIKNENGWDQYIGGVSEELCSTLEKIQDHDEFKVGNVTTGGCANGDGEVFVNAFKKYIEEKVAMFSYIAVGVAGLILFTIIVGVFVVCSMKNRMQAQNLSGQISGPPQWERYEETGSDVAYGSENPLHDDGTNRNRAYGGDIYGGDDIEEPVWRPRGNSRQNSAESLPTPPPRRKSELKREFSESAYSDYEEEFEDADNGKPGEGRRRLESISTDASGRFVVDDLPEDFVDDDETPNSGTRKRLESISTDASGRFVV